MITQEKFSELVSKELHRQSIHADLRIRVGFNNDIKINGELRLDEFVNNLYALIQSSK